MDLIRYPERVEPARFAPGLRDAPALYGLPCEVRFCRTCVISNQRPNSAVEYQHTRGTTKTTIHFDERGICDACNFAERKKHEIDWAERERQLRELCDRHRRHDGGYDCIVPGSGGKDSFFASHVLKTKFGMHPLTVTWAPHMYTDWGWRNFESWIHAGFDNYLMTPNGRVHRLLTRLSTDILFHPFQAFMLGQKSLAPKMALLFDIPLVFYGENEIEYGNPGDGNSAQRDWAYFSASDRSRIFLGGVSLEDLQEQFGVDPCDLQPYLPANPGQLAEKKVEVHYLGYYLKWHPQGCYYYAAEHGGFQAAPERTPGTYSKYNSIDDRIDDFHYFTTGIKFGIGRASYDAAQEIRSGDIDRAEGVSLVKRFDLEFPQRFAPEIYRYLSIPFKEFPQASRMFEQPIMDDGYFSRLTDQFRSPHLWVHECDAWRLRHAVWQQEAKVAEA